MCVYVSLLASECVCIDVGMLVCRYVDYTVYISTFWLG